MCTCVIHENIQCAYLYMSVQSLEILWRFMFTAEAWYSCGPPAHVHLRRSSNLKDKPSFLTTSVVSSPFPFCKCNNLSFEVFGNFAKPGVCAFHTVQLLFYFLCFNYAFYSFWLFFQKDFFPPKLLHLDEIKWLNTKVFSNFLYVTGLGANTSTAEDLVLNIFI